MFRYDLVFLFAYALSIVLFFVSDRYRLPVFPVLMVLAPAGEPPSGAAVAVLAEAGIDLRPHRASRLDRERLLSMHEVFTMSPQHLEFLLSELPELDGRARLLAEQSIPDPIGGSMDDYRRCSEALREAVERIAI